MSWFRLEYRLRRTHKTNIAHKWYELAVQFNRDLPIDFRHIFAIRSMQTHKQTVSKCISTDKTERRISKNRRGPCDLRATKENEILRICRTWQAAVSRKSHTTKSRMPVTSLVLNTVFHQFMRFPRNWMRDSLSSVTNEITTLLNPKYRS